MDCDGQHEPGRIAVLLEAIHDCDIVSGSRYLRDFRQDSLAPEDRRRINRQLNKGEALHALRRFLFFAEHGTLRRHQQEDQANQASCLTLVTNAVVAWNTVYVGAVLAQLRGEGHAITDETLGHLSPALYGHVNPYGKYQFDLAAAAQRQGLRPLRRPEDQLA